jgi:hypothetical protein
MDGNMWEDYCQKLLQMRYEDYQKVPAQFGGDYGIEGFTRSGIVFQCYCPDDDPSGRDLYEKQRDKITKDIKKFVKNVTEISALGAGTIREWHFLTPNYNNRDLLSHCRSKESEVQSKSLETVHSGFTICIKTEDAYIPERQTYIGAGGLRVQPSGEEPPLEELKKLLTSDNKIVLNIKTKLKKLALASDQRTDLITQSVRGYVVGKYELQILNEKFPSTCVSEGKLRNDLSGSLSSALIARLSTEAISDWLGRCPLNFFSDLEGNDENY